MKFSITYDIVTPESAEFGDFAECGFIAKDLTFRDAVSLFNAERSGNYIEADSHPISVNFPPRWFTACGETDENGNCRSIGFHLPLDITGASAMRVARLLGCYGAQ